MKIKSLLCISLLAASAGMMLPMAQAQAQAVVAIRVAPPAPRMERIPPQARGYAWSPGYWNYSGHRYVWVPGRSIRVKHGYRSYSAPVWRQDPRGNWVRQEGGWRR